MRARIMLPLAALVAASALAAVTATASANTLFVDQETFRVTWTSLRFRGSGVEIACPVTLEGSFEAPAIPKTVGVTFGQVARAALTEGSCTGGRARLLTETLPWRVQYRSFAGTLPNITSVNVSLVGASVLVEVLGLSCLYRSTEANPVRGSLTREAGGVITALTIEEGTSIPKFSGSALCPASGSMAGTGAPTVLGAATRIRLTLLSEEAGPIWDLVAGNINLPAGIVVGSTLVRNEAPFFTTVGTVTLGGVNPNRFQLINQEEAEACKAGKVLPKNLGNPPCRVTVRYIGTEPERPKSATVSITSSRWLWAVNGSFQVGA